MWFVHKAGRRALQYIKKINIRNRATNTTAQNKLGLALLHLLWFRSVHRAIAGRFTLLMVVYARIHIATPTICIMYTKLSMQKQTMCVRHAC